MIYVYIIRIDLRLLDFPNQWYWELISQISANTLNSIRQILLYKITTSLNYNTARLCIWVKVSGILIEGGGYI